MREGGHQLRIDWQVQAPAWDEVGLDAMPDDACRSQIEACVVRGVAGHENVSSLGPSLSASVAFSDDAAVAGLNRTYRGKDKPTNVLSFPSHTPDDEGDALYLGDVIIALETARREAAEVGKPLKEHVVHLVVHGLMHLYGFDHETDRQAAEMETLETKILEDLGLPDPYQEEEAAAASPV